MFKNVSIMLVVALIGGIAGAAAEVAYDRYAENRPALFIKGLYVGSDKGTNKVQGSTTNKITATHAPFSDTDALFQYDFPACATSGFAGDTSCHLNTPAFPCAGVKIGDVCFVTTDRSIADGGTTNSVWYEPIIVGNNLCAVVQHYVVTDAGVFNAPDAGYAVRCFSSQVQ